MINNYPDGAANDPRAPWNQKELPEFVPVCCKNCKAETVLNEDCLCEDCFIEEVSNQEDEECDYEDSIE